eukprot:g5086.t1
MDNNIDCFVKWTEYFKSRLAFLPSNSMHNDSPTEATKSASKKQRKNQRSEKKRAELRRSFQPNPAWTGIADLLAAAPAKQERENESENRTVIEAEPLDQGQQQEIDRDVLKLKLQEKLTAIRVKSGTAKLKKKTQSVRKMERKSAKIKKEKRIRSRLLTKKATKVEPPVKINNLQFTQLTGNGNQEDAEIRGKSRKRKLTKSLSKAQRNKEIEKSFAETGQGGERVFSTEWNHALQRASGERVLDDPQKIQKTIKNQKKQKIRSAKAWEQRLEAVEQQKQERQEKRQKNLKMRSDQKKRKKDMRRMNKST